MGGPLGEAGLNRSKKTPEELEAEAADQDDFTSKAIHYITMLYNTRDGRLDGVSSRLVLHVARTLTFN